MKSVRNTVKKESFAMVNEEEVKEIRVPNASVVALYRTVVSESVCFKMPPSAGMLRGGGPCR